MQRAEINAHLAEVNAAITEVTRRLKAGMPADAAACELLSAILSVNLLQLHAQLGMWDEK